MPGTEAQSLMREDKAQTGPDSPALDANGTGKAINNAAGDNYDVRGAMLGSGSGNFGSYNG